MSTIPTNLKDRVIATLTNCNSEPWFPHLTLDLTRDGWRRLYEKNGITDSTYGTARVILNDAKVPRQTVYTLDIQDTKGKTKDEIFVELLPKAISNTYNESGVNFYTEEEFPLELVPQPKKSITCSRSFGCTVESFEYLNEALDSYLIKASEKLRKQKLTANAVTVFLATNRFAKTEQYSNSLTFELANPSNSTRELKEWTKKALQQIYKQGFLYKKVGVILQGLQPEPSETIRLYNEPAYEKDKRLMEAIDKISNRFGRETVRFGMQKNKGCWQMRAEMKSKKYTTCLNEVVEIH